MGGHITDNWINDNRVEDVYILYQKVISKGRIDERQESALSWLQPAVKAEMSSLIELHPAHWVFRASTSTDLTTAA